MSRQGKFRTVFAGLKVTACAAVAAVSITHSALADNSTKIPRHHAAPKASSSKCLCGYGISGYDNINCVPVADCEWEHATCRGTC
jgi:hypothetical protein